MYALCGWYKHDTEAGETGVTECGCFIYQLFSVQNSAFCDLLQGFEKGIVIRNADALFVTFSPFCVPWPVTGVWGGHCEAEDAGLMHQLPELRGYSEEWSSEHVTILCARGHGGHSGMTLGKSSYTHRFRQLLYYQDFTAIERVCHPIVDFHYSYLANEIPWLTWVNKIVLRLEVAFWAPYTIFVNIICLAGHGMIEIVLKSHIHVVTWLNDLFTHGYFIVVLCWILEYFTHMTAAEIMVGGNQAGHGGNQDQ